MGTDESESHSRRFDRLVAEGRTGVEADPFTASAADSAAKKRKWDEEAAVSAGAEGVPKKKSRLDTAEPVAAAAVGEEDAAEKSEWDDVAGGHGAVISGHEEAVLLERNAACDMQNKFGRTPLYYASMEGHVATVKLLLKHGAEVWSVKNADGLTPLHCAAIHGHVETARVLLEHNAAVCNVQSQQGRTPLHYASKGDT